MADLVGQGPLSLARLLKSSKRVEEAAQLSDHHVRALGGRKASSLKVGRDLADVLARSGRLDEAVAQCEQVLVEHVKVLGPVARDTFAVRGTLAGLLVRSRRFDEAVVHFEQLRVDRVRVLGPDHHDTLANRESLAWALGLAGRVDEAVVQFEQLRDDRERVLGGDHSNTLHTRSTLARLLAWSQQPDEAVVAQLGQPPDDGVQAPSRMPPTRRRRGGRGRSRPRMHPDHRANLHARSSFADLLVRSGRVDEAFALLEQLLDDRVRVLGADHPDTLLTRSDLARLLAQPQQSDGAVAPSGQPHNEGV